MRSPNILVLISCWMVCIAVQAQQKQTNAYQPGRQEMMKRYERMKLLDSLTKNSVYKTSVLPVWDKNGNKFWYQNLLADSVREFIAIDPSTASRKPAFSRIQLTVALEKTTGKKYDSAKLPIRLTALDLSGGQFTFILGTDRYSCRISDYELQKITAPASLFNYANGSGFTRRSRWMNFQTDSISPDKQWAAFVKDGKIMLQGKNQASRQLSPDTTAGMVWDDLAWSPDSRYLVAYKVKPYEDSSIYYVTKAAPGTMRGKMHSIPYKQPGDPFSTYEMFVFDIADGKATKVNTETIDFFGAPALQFRKSDPGYFLFERIDRGHQRFRIIEADRITGNTKTIYEEKTNTFQYESRIYSDYIAESNEIILSSEKDGYRHIYLLDALTGQVKNPITSGNWIVKEIDSIDRKKRTVLFRAAGMQAGEDPYYVHHYRIDFDGKNLQRLNPEKGTHTVSYSPDGKYMTDTWSEVNIAPVTVLKETGGGKKIMELERADTSNRKKLQIPLPVPFMAKGRDGSTDIWGVVCRPSNFDPSKKYPVIENIYAGPQDAFVPKSYLPYGEMQSIAELGFIVVQIDGMGTANRSKAFHDVCWKNLADAGFPDRIAWIRALARQYPWVDTARVGLYGTSAGGQNSLGGLLFHPQFYKAAASSCGCHDNRVDKQWWNEQWMGYPVGKHYDEQSNVTNAHKLKGDLLLIVGDEDSNVPPESTYRVADALIKANKQFDFLSVPGMGHSDGGTYGRLKRKDFFVKSLLGVDPPKRNAL